MRSLFVWPSSYSLMGATALMAVILLLPLAGTSPRYLPDALVAYALVLIPVPLLLHGFLLAARNYATLRLLALGAVSSALGLPLRASETLTGRTRWHFWLGDRLFRTA